MIAAALPSEVRAAKARTRHTLVSALPPRHSALGVGRQDCVSYSVRPRRPSAILVPKEGTEREELMEMGGLDIVGLDIMV